MLDLDLKEEHLQVRDLARRFADEVVGPRATELDEKEEFPTDIVKQMGELGFMGLPYPEKYGGAGLDTLAYVIAVEQIARWCGSTAITLAAHVSLGCGPIYANGTEEQKLKYLVPMAKGEAIGAFGLTEPNAGSDAAGTQTRAGQGRRRLARQRLEDLHHQRQRGEVHHVHRAHRLEQGHEGHHARSSWTRRTPGSASASARRKMGLHGLRHRRGRVRGLLRPRRRSHRRSDRRLHRVHAHAHRRAHLDRRAGARARAGRVRAQHRASPRSGSSSASRSRTSRPSSSCSPTWRRSIEAGTRCSSTRRRCCKDAGQSTT